MKCFKVILIKYMMYELSRHNQINFAFVLNCSGAEIQMKSNWPTVRQGVTA